MLIKTARYITIILVVLVVAIIILGGGFGRKNKTTINNGNATLFAHRGVTEFNVENSLESFSEAKRIGFIAVEMDLSQTKDGRVIIFHDKSAKRLLNIDRDVNALNWEEIKDQNLMYKGKETTNKIVTLEKFLKIKGKMTFVYLDVKESSKVLADSILFLENKNRNFNNVIIASENILFLVYLKVKKPELKVVLEGFNKGKEWLYYFIPKNFKPDFYSSFLNEVDENHMQFLSDNDLLDYRIVYGVNSSNISDAFKLGLHNIIFDYDSSNSGDIKNLENTLNRNRRD